MSTRTGQYRGVHPASEPTTRDTDGNLRLLAAAGIALLVCLVIEYGTLLLGLRHGWIGTHVFVGLVLVPVVAWKLAVVAYRFGRYYTHDPDYRRAGPPQIVLRIIAPVLVAAIVVLLGSGILLVIGQHADDRTIRGLHKLSYLVVSAALIAHVLAYIGASARGLLADVTAGTRRAWLRIVALGAVIAIAVGFAVLLPHHTRIEQRDRGRDGFQRQNAEGLR